MQNSKPSSTAISGTACGITSQAISDDLWRRLSTDKASCLNRNCHYYRECRSLSPGAKFRKPKWWWLTTPR